MEIANYAGHLNKYVLSVIAEIKMHLTGSEDSSVGRALLFSMTKLDSISVTFIYYPWSCQE